MNSISAVLFQSFPSPERNLVDACRQGDQRAQLQIYKIYYKLIFNICLRVVPDHLKAEEIMHEVILTVLEEIRSSRDIPVFSELLGKILDVTLKAEREGAVSTASNFERNKN
jgi:hypothetical protein